MASKSRCILAEIQTQTFPRCAVQFEVAASEKKGEMPLGRKKATCRAGSVSTPRTREPGWRKKVRFKRSLGILRLEVPCEFNETMFENPKTLRIKIQDSGSSEKTNSFGCGILASTAGGSLAPLVAPLDPALVLLYCERRRPPRSNNTRQPHHNN